MNINEAFSGSYAKDVPMRDIFHKANQILSGRGKKIIIRELGEDDQCQTTVKKTFVFLAEPTMSSEDPGEPQVTIRKSFDSVSRCEKFSFRVKGFFYVNHQRHLVKMNYCHTLKIQLRWKSKTTSPKKSVTLA